MEHEKIIKLLEFLAYQAHIEKDNTGIVIKNFQYATNIKIEGLPDWNYKVEFALKTDKNPFKKLGENKGESFVLPYSIMKVFLDSLTDEINNQQNNNIIEKYGQSFFDEKKEEILTILNTNTKIEEEFQYYILSYSTQLFNNVMLIEKPHEETSVLSHDFINLTYTYLVSYENENNGLDSTYQTQKIKLSIPAIEIENYTILSQCFNKPSKNNYASLMDVLKRNNQDDKMSKLLLYTKLEIELDVHKKAKTKTKKI